MLETILIGASYQIIKNVDLINSTSYDFYFMSHVDIEEAFNGIWNLVCAALLFRMNMATIPYDVVANIVFQSILLQDNYIYVFYCVLLPKIFCSFFY